MWKNLSIKTQLILILLIPVSGLVYLTFTNSQNSYNKYTKIDHSLQNINNIANFSKVINLISDERGLHLLSTFDSSRKGEYDNKVKETNEWFLNFKTSDSAIIKNLTIAKALLKKVRSDAEKNQISPEKIFNQYVSINFFFNNIIESQIIDCQIPEFTKLANNFNCYNDLENATTLIRGIILNKVTNKTTSTVLEALYQEAMIINNSIQFRLTNFDKNGINNGIIEYKKSDEFKSFLANSESVINNNQNNITTEKWWNTSALIVSKISKLEKDNLNYIIDYAAQKKREAFTSVALTITLLIVLLLTNFLLFFKLINNTSSTLKNVSSSIRRIALGKIDFKHNLSGNAEFYSINNSLKDLIKAIKEQIDLSAKISSGNYGDTIELRSTSDTLNDSLNNMSLELKKFNDESNKNSLLEKNIIQVNKSIIDSKDLTEFGSNLCSILINQTNGCQAVFYITDYIDHKDDLIKIGSYAENQDTPKTIQIGEGLVGEVFKSNQQKCLNNLQSGYSSITSSLGKSPVYNVLITPVSFKNSVIGVIEIGSFENFNDTDKKLLNILADSVGSAIEVFIRNEELRLSVAEINRKNNILQVQEEELRQNNEELNKQTLLLQQSEEELKNQAAELEQTNAYLEEKGRELENKNYEIEIKNSDLTIAQEELNIKSEEIAQASKYKSEFLANMSHELRTPLNSILILSDLLKENVNGNLSNSQIDNLSVINSSGKDLLNLITDILDISKIESGKVEVYPEETVIERIFSDMDSLFRAQMEKKEINFKTIIKNDCPRTINTDVGKIEQILKNFLSNALKFTPNKGEVSLTFDSGIEKQEYLTPSLALLPANEILSIHIKDNGIGISEENKKKLFQTFQQADSSTSRKYGGTGLGLFISKELAILLGGEVSFKSKLNNGSTFSVFVPITYKNTNSNPTEAKENNIQEEVSIETEYPNPEKEFVDLAANIKDDRNKADIDDKTILIIEDDTSFAEVLLQVAHDNGFKAIIAHQGETGFQYAKKYSPKAIILDMKLPGIDGWTVLKWLKEDPELQHIPVHVMSGMKREKLAKEMGAFDFLVKPITSQKLKNAFQSIENQINKVYKKVLIVEDDVKLNYSIKELVHSSDKNVICMQAHSRLEAENILKNDEIDCAIIDLSLPDSNNIKAVSELKKISKNPNIKIIVNTGKNLSDEDQLELEKNADSIVIKTNDVTERLKDELLLFINKIESTEEREYKNAPNLSGGEILKNKNILIVDDDIRNIYALSAALTSKGAVILTAFNGIEALKVLDDNSNIDIVLMDIMMPEMDGFEATRKIRENIKWRDLPIIALTAKAMKGDRDEILKAGASDYQSKPIDIQKLISLISIWIYK
ncbi:response regulator [Flavobacterium granuli]|uniref:histidine kinase n=1 Tax=Flavobacterium granuli TaxID=280093 RepID=A0A1M5JCF2_9FLAO|nr:response regulator [Flavobacterium granuli]PRZ28322.1 signal transduction histidine kinase [Flavobacterium granuli]SHG38237.1 signal transduction histidine kinase [Flavobacterium granuli]